MGELQSAVDALASDDLTSLFGPQLLERLTPLLRAHTALVAAITRTVRECEKTGAAEHDGLKTMQSWLRGHARWSKSSAAQLVANGRALEHLPAVAAGFATGAITADQVAVAAQVAAPARLAQAAEQGVDLRGFDEALAEAAINSPARLPEVVELVLAALDPDGPEPDPTEGRRLSIARHADGSVSGRFDLDAVGGEKVQAALESIVQASRPKGDERTRAQQNADALVQLCDNQLASGHLPFLRSEKPHLVVTIGIDDLLDPSPGPNAAETGFGATISAAAARWAACDAKVSRMVLDADGLPLDVGRSKRLVPAHIRRAVERRDRHCVFAGCSAPTHWCDVHHQLEWLRDHGDTSLENSALLCERHHTKVHHGFRVERPPDGRWRTYRPDGSQILIGPALQV
jgi:hypothetical protein